MATKLIKHNNSKDVFDKVVQHEDELATEATGVEETEASEAAETSEVAESALAVESPPRRRWLRLMRAPAVEEVQADAAEDEDVAEIQPPGKRWRRRLLVGAGTVIVVAILGGTGFLGWQLKQQRDIHDAGRAALAAAQNYAVALTSIDSGNVDKNFSQVVDGSTGEFKDMYTQSASQLRQVLIDNKAMAKGTVIDSAIKSATKTKVDVLLFVDQWVSNAVTPQPRMDRSRVAITMELVDGRWLASKVDLK